MRRRTLVTFSILLMAVGLWWQISGRNTDDVNTQSPPAESTTSSTVPADDFFSDQQSDAEAPEQPPVDDADVTNLQTPEAASTCQPVQQGFGIEMKDWGSIKLPYAAQWPKNQPGQPVDCAPDTDFGGAVVAAHSLNLEEFSPELIPQIAADTPARQTRINLHEGKKDPAVEVVPCQTLGWDKEDGISVWYIYWQCEGGSVSVKSIRMERAGNTWLLVYDITGTVPTGQAPAGIEYFPFEGGD